MRQKQARLEKHKQRKLAQQDERKQKRNAKQEKLEAFFDAGRGPKPGMDGAIVVSDAGAPLPTGFDMGRLNIFRLKHVAVNWPRSLLL